MSRFISFMFVACVGFIGLAGCSTPEDPAEPAAAPEMTKAMPETIEVEVLHVSEEFANINTSITRDELAAKGITESSWIAVTYNGKTYPMLMGKDYSDVKKGEWIARIDDEDNRLQLAVSFGNAATDMGCAIGDKIQIQLTEAPAMEMEMETAKSQPAG